ncbi:hypothetical protein ILP92_10580 [Maribius pontilimi]|uniref:DUF6468 domain-containing protein n=1 Tax=Palleronia pontilimi TaxID=1964209 RepID=A0A934IIH7_9RHOB|nr:DUF6468 domain-containing protein [Palleronia pontilimi]MBJ3763190.1 hypothetical protein [Palleronia pontilimi]
MDLIADMLLILGALAVAFYCFVLSRRLSRFTDLEKGVGGAVAVLSAQVDDLNRAVARAKSASEGAGDDLRALTERADAVARRLELHVASLHDLPDLPATPPRAPTAEPAAPEARTPEAPKSAVAPSVRSYFSSQRLRATEMG